MFIEFDKDYLRELFEQGRTSDKKHRYQPEVIKRRSRLLNVPSMLKCCTASIRLITKC